MLKLKLISVGKTKEEWLDAAIDEYTKRLKPVMAIEFLWVKNDEQLIAAVEKESGVVCLDAAGKQMTSEQFASFISKSFEDNGSRLTLVIGGAEGLPPKLKNYPLISLSLMTMTHQIVRLVLMEQMYRAFEILKGSKYHK
jgi:23S rRNA (pseudouridine1915-N3)-methyltransferase